MKLKFGIEAILHPKTTLNDSEHYVEKIDESLSRGTASPIDSDCCSEASLSLKGSSNDAMKERLLAPFAEDFPLNKKVLAKHFPTDIKFRDGLPVKSANLSRTQRALQYHPYIPSKDAPKRYFPESPVNKLHCPHSVRGKSESPNSRLFSLSETLASQESVQMQEGEKFRLLNSNSSLGRSWKKDRISSPQHKSMSVSSSPAEHHSFSRSPTLTGRSDHASFERVQEANLKGRRNSDCDDVFNNSERSPKALKDLSSFWRPKPLSSRGMSSSSSSPGYVTSPDHLNKRST